MDISHKAFPWLNMSDRQMVILATQYCSGMYSMLPSHPEYAARMEASRQWRVRARRIIRLRNFAAKSQRYTAHVSRL